MPLQGRCVLDVGCGSGSWLADFERWGVAQRGLAGIDLSPERVSKARSHISGSSKRRGGEQSLKADIRVGDASHLPWPTASFDIVVQSTVFTSILDPDMREAVAREMLRVLKPNGVLLWYDFFVNNPRNASVRGVSSSEVRRLFRGCSVSLQRVTLAPPIIRALVPRFSMAASLLQRLRVLDTHYLGFIRR